MKVINASKGKCGNHKLKSPHVMLRRTSLQEVSMSVKIRRERPIEGHNVPSARLIALPPTRPLNQRGANLAPSKTSCASPGQGPL